MTFQTYSIEEFEKLTAENERLSMQPRITPTMAQMLLDAAEAHCEVDYDEVYHQIRIFAHETTDDIYDSWKVIKEIAAQTTKETDIGSEK